MDILDLKSVAKLLTRYYINKSHKNFKWDSKHPCGLGGYKTTRRQSWGSETISHFDSNLTFLAWGGEQANFSSLFYLKLWT